VIGGVSDYLKRFGTHVPRLSGSWLEIRSSIPVDHICELGIFNGWVTRVRFKNENEPFLDQPWDGWQALADTKRSRCVRHFDDEGLPENKVPGKIVPYEDHSGGTANPLCNDWHCLYFKTNAQALQGPSYSESTIPRLRENGENLAWTLSYLMTAEPERFDRIMQSLRDVVPIVKRVRSRPVQLARLEKKTIVINKQEKIYDETQPVMGQELIFDMVSGNGLPASSVSEGTLVLAILTLIHQSDDINLIMLDDVELGLHPKAQRDLIKQLRKVQDSHPKLQIIVSTHSPYIVDEFKAEDVWLFAPDHEGCAVSKRLSDHPDAKRSLEVLTTGEFWSAEGEDWVASKPATKTQKTA